MKTRLVPLFATVLILSGAARPALAQPPNDALARDIVRLLDATGSATMAEQMTEGATIGQRRAGELMPDVQAEIQRRLRAEKIIE